MSAKVLELLKTYRTDLAGRASVASYWGDITAWHARTRPLIAKHFADQCDVFDSFLNVTWTVLPRPIGTLGRQPDISRIEAEELSANNRESATAKKRLMAFMDGLIEVSSTLDPLQPTTHESDALFEEINRLVAQSLITQQYKRVIASDLVEAHNAYRGRAFKACVVMLGSALEGLMLGTLQRADVIIALSASGTSAPGPIRRIGTGDPALADKIGDELTFEDFKVCICQRALKTSQ